MLAFNQEPEIITYWDEPTITMDYENHDLHQIIHENWIQNKISKVVLSCATLPKEEEICDTIMDFRARFENAEIFTIKSYDCRKTISLTNKNGYCVLPHLLFAEYSVIRQSVRHCEENKSLLRYFDLGEVVRFLKYVNDNDLVDEEYNIDSYFGTDIASISMDSVKTYYLEVLKHVFADVLGGELHWQSPFCSSWQTQCKIWQDSARAREDRWQLPPLQLAQAPSPACCRWLPAPCRSSQSSSRRKLPATRSWQRFAT
jgi:hypothetical protein